MSGLVQIRHGYRARWNELTFQVEEQEPRWTLQVLDSDSRQLYSAQRCNRKAAETAGLEFVRFNPVGDGRRLDFAERLVWQEYW